VRFGKSDVMVSMTEGPPRVFISHAQQDADFAKTLKEWLEETLRNGIECFVSTDGAVPLGRPWLDELSLALEQSSLMLVLVSQESSSSRWIDFEVGAAFVRQVRVVPICIGGVTVADLESPLDSRQGIELPNEVAERRLLSLVADLAGLTVPSVPPRLPIPGRYLGGARAKQSATTRLFASTNHENFLALFEALVAEARHVVLVGTGLNVLYHRGPLELLKGPANCHWEIYVANPYSPEVQARLIEEEAASPRPVVGKSGLVSRLESLLDFQEQSGSPEALTIKSFSHYPTISFFIVDRQHYFFYPYGFALLGDFSPVWYGRADDPRDATVVAFLKRQHELTREASVDAALIHDLRSGRHISEERRRQIEKELVPVAVYVVPEKNSSLYEFGSACLGFDLRRQAQVKSRWPQDYTRAGAPYGFHLTVADALYLAEEAQLRVLIKELRSVAEGLRPFSVGLQITAGFPEHNSVSIACHDETGSLEALHHELVSRCYGRAVASNYSRFFGEDRAATNRSYATNPARSSLMIERYHAPYILNEFRPHFSLLSNVAPGDLASAQASLENDLPTRSLLVGSLCVLTRGPAGSNWRIAAELALRG
jgi:hypothetical protein